MEWSISSTEMAEIMNKMSTLEIFIVKQMKKKCKVLKQNKKKLSEKKNEMIQNN